MSEQVLTVSQLMDRWHCGRRAVLKLIKSNELKAFTLGKKTYRITLDEVLRVEKQRAA